MSIPPNARRAPILANETEIKVGPVRLIDRFYKKPDGTTHKSRIVYHPDCICVAALTEDDRVIVVREFRYGPNDFVVNFVGGAVEDGETPEIAAARELHEETGYKAGRLVRLGERHIDAYCTGKRYFILAYGCVLDHDATPEPEVETHVITTKDFLKLVQSNTWLDLDAALLLERQFRM